MRGIFAPTFAGNFFIPVHRKILGAIHDVYDEREKVNHLSVSNRLREKGELIHAAVLRV